MIDSVPVRCPFIPKPMIHRAADRLRDEHWAKEPPVNMELVVERIGLDINPISGLRDHDIDALLRMNRNEIIVDYSQYMDDGCSNRLRFSLAHEVGHWILHKKELARLGRLDIQSEDDYLEHFIVLPANEHSHFEYQANEFAGRLLVPIEELLNVVKEQIDTRKGNMIFARMYSSDPKQTIDMMSPKICKIFGVSHSVISRRIEREDVVERLAG